MICSKTHQLLEMGMTAHPPSFCCGVRYVVSRSSCCDVAIWLSLVVVVVSRMCGCRVGDNVM